MKPVKKLLLGGDDVFIVDCFLVLELNACGRGFITVKTDKDYIGQLARLDVGYNNSTFRWFTGFVESSQPAATGHQKLFVREVIHSLDRKMACAFQHPTLKTVTDYLEVQTGIKFILPSAPYVNKPVPHFTQNGNGYQILSALGRVFSIPDYVYQQLPDGSIFVGSYQHSLFAKKPVSIPAEFALKTAGNSLTVPVIPSLRPGVIVDGRRLKRIDLRNDEITLSYDDGPAQKSPEQRQIEKLYPELSNGLHLSKQAIVVGYADSADTGAIADAFRPRYAVDLQLLDDNGQPDNETPVYPAVPLPVPMGGAECGQFQYPQLGVKVELGFMAGRQDKPFIKQILSSDLILPAIQPGEQLQQQRDGVFQRVTVGGNMQRNTDQSLIDNSNSRVITANSETATITERRANVAANDVQQVGGTSKLLAGNIQQLSSGNYNVAALADIVEKAEGIKKSIAGVQQQIIAPQVHLGPDGINILNLMTETLDLIQSLSNALSSHTHPTTAPPVNALTITAIGTAAGALKSKYQPIIA